MKAYESMKVLSKGERRREELLLRKYESTSQRGEKNSFYRGIEIDVSMKVPYIEESKTTFMNFVALIHPL